RGAKGHRRARHWDAIRIRNCSDYRILLESGVWVRVRYGQGFLESEVTQKSNVQFKRSTFFQSNLSPAFLLKANGFNTENPRVSGRRNIVKLVATNAIRGHPERFPRLVAKGDNRTWDHPSAYISNLSAHLAGHCADCGLNDIRLTGQHDAHAKDRPEEWHSG